MSFKIDSYYNPHLNLGTNRLDTVLSVSATEIEAVKQSIKKVFGYMLDKSGSMDEKNKILSAKLALRQQIDMISENDYFFIITFDNSSNLLMPLNLATKENKKIAHDLIQKIKPEGGTIMSKSLLKAKEEFDKAGPCIAYAQFVTDGQNDNSDTNAMDKAIEKCKGLFQVDAWGIGLDWDTKQLKKIANSLMGRADAVPNPENLEEVFKQALNSAISKGIGDVKLRLQTPKTSKIISIKQQMPEILDLNKFIQKIDEKNIDIPLGAWANESRDYYIVAEIEAQEENEEMMVFRPKIIYTINGEKIIVDGDRVIVTWSSNEGLTTCLNEQVSHYNGQQEIAESIKEGLEAKNRGDYETATVLLGKAMKLATDSNNEEVTQRLKKVVDIIDINEGTVRIKSNNKAAEMELDMGGTRTVRRRPANPTSTN